MRLVGEDGELIEQVIPGRRVLLAVEAIDRSGQTYSSILGTLDLGLIRLSSRGGQAIVFGGRVVFEPSDDPQAIPPSGYAIDLHWADETGSPYTTGFAADWAAVRGPEPGDVTSIGFVLGGVTQCGDGIGRVVPEDRIAVEVRVRDRGGREYRTGEGHRLTLPWDRLEIALDPLLQRREAGAISATSDSAESPLSIDVGYVGATVAHARGAIVADRSLADGPDPGDVVQFDAEVPASIAPMSSVAFTIAVQDRHGCVYRLGQERPRLPESAIVCEANGLRLDLRSRTLTSTSSYAASAGAEYAVACALADRSEMRVERRLTPDLVSALFAYARGDSQIEVAGADASDGQAGDGGQGGAFMTGEPGRDGQPGGAGAGGGPGPNVHVFAARAKAHDGRTEFVVYVVERDGRRTTLVRSAGQPIRLSSAGGSGSRGGRGGVGGSGAIGPVGTNGSAGGTGGNGGDGGEAGDGGQGGDGGNIEILLASSDLADLVVARTVGGRGGDGGEGGVAGGGGPGGVGGVRTEQVRVGTTTMAQMSLGPQGSMGQSGSGGASGSRGRQGRSGTVHTRVDTQVVHAAIRAASPPFLAMLQLDGAIGGAGDAEALARHESEVRRSEELAENPAAPAGEAREREEAEQAALRAERRDERRAELAEQFARDRAESGARLQAGLQGAVDQFGQGLRSMSDERQALQDQTAALLERDRQARTDRETQAARDRDAEREVRREREAEARRSAEQERVRREAQARDVQRERAREEERQLAIARAQSRTQLMIRAPLRIGNGLQVIARRIPNFLPCVRSDGSGPHGQLIAIRVNNTTEWLAEVRVQATDNDFSGGQGPSLWWRIEPRTAIGTHEESGIMTLCAERGVDPAATFRIESRAVPCPRSAGRFPWNGCDCGSEAQGTPLVFEDGGMTYGACCEQSAFDYERLICRAR